MGNKQPVDLGSPGRSRLGGDVPESLCKGSPELQFVERLQPTRRGEASRSFWEGKGHGYGDRANLHVQLSSGCSVRALAEDTQEASSPVRPGWKVGQEGAQVPGLGLSDGQGTPHAGPVLGVLQAAG